MKRLLFVLFLAFISFSIASYGHSEIMLERTWTVEDSGAEGEVAFSGFFVLNNSYHRVLLFSTNPRMTVSSDDGFLKLHYNDTKKGKRLDLKGTALVSLDYDTHLNDDPVLKARVLEFDSLTVPNLEIRKQANLLKSDSTLETVLSITSWVHSNMEYDILYPRGHNAQEVFKDRRGLCVDYSHLFISMARSVGLETRYISGYVVAEEWQPHAWVEVWVPEYGWLPVDPTFGDIGILDNSHVVIGVGNNNTDIFDSISYTNNETSFKVNDKLAVQLSEEDPDYADLSIGFNESNLTVQVLLKNPRDEYIFGAYSFSSPKEYGGREEGLVLLSPNEERTISYVLDSSILEPGYVYSIPVSASFNDVSSQYTVVIEKRKPAPLEDPEIDINLDAEPTCIPPGLVLLTLLGYGIMGFWNEISKRRKIS